jgi:hypothetical protein
MNFSIHSLRMKFAQRRALMPIVSSLALLLLVLQNTELTHTHADGIQGFQCEICLKVGAGDDAIAVRSTPLFFASIGQSYPASPLDSILFLARLPANSRAPPQA